ncbi:MAG: hypothetical protein IIZ89_06210, partial [Muribaculaceae bacterium]|nr:hypothetical protein [Muribaculaceae bacterium]
MDERITQERAAHVAQQEALMHEMSKTIARRIERVLFEREMSHKDFARLVGHSQGEVSRKLSRRRFRYRKHRRFRRSREFTGCGKGNGNYVEPDCQCPKH